MIKDKKEYKKYMCKYMKDKYRKRRIIAIKLLGGKCSRCNKKTNLEFDHINPNEKKFSISKLWSISEEKYFNEIKKCQLLCKYCHIKKTVEEDRGQKIARDTHGTLSSYRYCRCKKCKKVKSDYDKNYYIKIRKKKILL